eukprot:jgi/Mesvir1/10222/Mv08542-RA.1
MNGVPQYIYQKEIELAIARRKKQRRLTRIAQLHALDDQRVSACVFCRREGLKEGWKFHGAWQETIPLDESPAPWLLVCGPCYDKRYGVGRDESDMLKNMKAAPNKRLLYHLTIHNDAVFVMNYISAI